jgi:DNA polymerase-3 subunit alpha
MLLFKDIPEAIQNTHEIAEKCNLEIQFGQMLLPKFPVEDAPGFLKRLVYKNLPIRLPNRPPNVMKRLNYELEVLSRTWALRVLFLIVHDIVIGANKMKSRWPDPGLQQEA